MQMLEAPLKSSMVNLEGRGQSELAECSRNMGAALVEEGAHVLDLPTTFQVATASRTQSGSSLRRIDIRAIWCRQLAKAIDDGSNPIDHCRLIIGLGILETVSPDRRRLR